jgi:hypothetical protein
MPQLLVRDVPQDVVVALKRSARSTDEAPKPSTASYRKKSCAPGALDFGNARPLCEKKRGPHRGAVGGADPQEPRRAVAHHETVTADRRFATLASTLALAGGVRLLAT